MAIGHFHIVPRQLVQWVWKEIYLAQELAGIKGQRIGVGDIG